MAVSAQTLVGEAIWLHPGFGMVRMDLCDGQVSVEGGPWHGHYHLYQNSCFAQPCLDICFSGKRNGGARFEEQVPHHMKPLGQHVYRNHNNEQIIVVCNRSMPMTIARHGATDTFFDMNEFHCVSEFAYCHPCQNESSLRLGVYDSMYKVSFNGQPPTGCWSYHDFPNMHAPPSGFDTSRGVLSVAFHCKGDESKQETTLYAVVSGTTDVYRAIGYVDPSGASRIYSDNELLLLRKWHIVLVCQRHVSLS
jgi:hypothetical protein